MTGTKKLTFVCMIEDCTGVVVSEHPQTTKTKNDSQRALGETTVGKPLGAVDKITRNDEQHIGGYQGGRLSNQRGNTKYAGSKNKNFGHDSNI